MPQFRHDSRDRNGQATSGMLEAVDASGAAAMLNQQGLVPIRIIGVESSSRRFASRDAASEPSVQQDRTLESIPAGLKPMLRKRVSDVELQLLTRELAAMLKAGVPIMRALALLQESSSNPALQMAVGRLASDLDSGLDFATALERESRRNGLFSTYYVSLVRVAEATGQLEQGLLNLARHLQFLRETREQIATALRYPSFVLIATAAAVAIVNLLVIPQFERVFKGMNTKLPVLTELLLSTSRLFVQAWPLLLIACALAFFAYRYWAATERGALIRDRVLLRSPVIGDIVRRTSLSRFATTLATALKSGVPVAQALTIVADTLGNREYADAVAGMRSRVERGESLRIASAGSGLFPPILQQVISVGEETGALDELLAEMGSHYQSEVEYEISRLSARIEPILIVLLGAIVLVLALGVFMPMWEMGRASMGKR